MSIKITEKQLHEDYINAVTQTARHHEDPNGLFSLETVLNTWNDFLKKLSECDELNIVNKARLEIIANQVIVALKTQNRNRANN